MSNNCKLLGLLCTIFIFCVSFPSASAQGAQQEGESVYRGLDNNSRTGSTALTVTFDRSGNATVKRTETKINESDVRTLYLFADRGSIKNTEGNIELEPNDSGTYWLIDFGSESAARVTTNTLEVSCSCTDGEGSCRVVHTQQGDLQQTYCDTQFCSECRLEVTSNTSSIGNSVLLIQANNVEFQ